MSLQDYGRSYLEQQASKAASSIPQVSIDDIFVEDEDLSKAQRLVLLDTITLKNVGEKLDIDSFEKCSMFWKIDVGTLFDSTYKHQLPFLKIALHPWQLFSIWWMLDCESRGITGILADGMGLGKTFSAIVVALMDHQIALNKSEVAEALEASESGELTIHITPSERAHPNRCNNNIAFQCACEPGSLASTFVPTNKATVFCTTAILTHQWIREFNHLVDQEKAQVQLYHTRTKENISDAIELTTNERRRIRQSQEETKAAIIITNYEVYYTKIIEYDSSEKRKIKSKKSGSRRTLPWDTDPTDPPPALPHGRLFADEPYSCVTSDHRVIDSLKDTRLNDINIWLINATILSNKGLDKISSWIELLTQHNGWDQPEHKLHSVCSSDAVRTANNNFLRWLDASHEWEYRNSMSAFGLIIQKITLQRTGSTIWPDGKPILVLPPMVERSVDLNLEARFQRDYDRLPNNVKRRCTATFPGAASSFIGNHPLTGTVEDTRSAASRERIEMRLPHYMATSPKFQHFEQLYTHSQAPQVPQGWLSQRTQFSVDNDGAEMQTILFFHQPWSAFVWHKCLVQRFGEESAYLISCDTTRAQRRKILGLFNPTPVNGSTAPKDQKRARFLCTTYPIAACGLNICGPCKVVLVEPSNEQLLEEQAVARCWRYGQRNDVEVIRYTTTSDERAIARENFRVAIAAQAAPRRLKFA